MVLDEAVDPTSSGPRAQHGATEMRYHAVWSIYKFRQGNPLTDHVTVQGVRRLGILVTATLVLSVLIELFTLIKYTCGPCTSKNKYTIKDKSEKISQEHSHVN